MPHFSARSCDGFNTARPLKSRAASRRGAALTFFTALLAIVAAGAVIGISTPSGTITIETADPLVRVSVSQEGKLIEIADQDNAWSVRLREGVYEVQIVRGDDRLELAGDRLIVRRGETTRVAVTRSDSKPTSPPEAPRTARPRPPAATKDPASLDGTWQITEASNFGGQPYSGRLRMRTSDNGLMKVEWHDESGQQPVQRGFGFVRDEHLLAAWGVQPDFGVMLYEIRPNGTLLGTWTHAIATQQLGKETATGGQPGSLEGSYEVHGSSIAAAGGQYDGQLSLERQGDVYHASWKAAGSQYTGIGLRQGKWLLIGWSMANAGPYGVVDYELQGNTALGRWTMAGQTTLETENLKRVDAAP